MKYAMDVALAAWPSYDAYNRRCYISNISKNERRTYHIGFMAHLGTGHINKPSVKRSPAYGAYAKRTKASKRLLFFIMFYSAYNRTLYFIQRAPFILRKC